MASGLTLHNRGTVTYAGPQTVDGDKFVTIGVKDGAKDDVIVLDAGKQAEGVAKRIKPGDVVSQYLDKQGHSTVYNETQRYMSHDDGKGHWKTEPMQEIALKGKVTAVVRDPDPKHKDHAIVSIADKDGHVTKVDITDKAGQRIDKMMKIGDQVEGSLKDVPGGRDTVLHDKTRHLTVKDDHEKGFAVAMDPPERARPGRSLTR